VPDEADDDVDTAEGKKKEGGNKRKVIDKVREDSSTDTVGRESACSSVSVRR
jgi:hypothetical protein